MSCKPMSSEEYIRRAKVIHGDRYDYSKMNYKLRSDKITITCPKHGDFQQSAHNHLNKNGCRSCWKEVIKYNQSNTNSFIQKAKEVHGDKYNYSKVNYINNHTKVIIICPIHGEFKQKPNSHIDMKAGCPRCKKSKGELAISKILNKYNILYEDEYKLPNYNFEYDFYLPKQNIFIEFHGKQHYEPIEWFGGEKVFKYIQQCDAFKRSLAREYRIPMLEFNYKQFKNVPEEQFENLIISSIGRIS